MMEILRLLLKRLGPGLITAAVVLGPGSIIASSRAGAERGYTLVWMLAVACLLMATFTAMGARLGCTLGMTPLQYVAQRWGRPLAMLAGLAAFLVTAGFQFGNNIGVAAGMANVTHTPGWVWPIVFTALSLVFLFAAKQVYRLIELLMIALVSLMVIAFAGNLFWTGLDLPGLAAGLRPRPLTKEDELIARAMLATNFSAVAAFYQAYLVREKGWRAENLKTALIDAWLGISILGAIALIIMTGSAQTLYGMDRSFDDVGELAQQLSGILGPLANVVFSCGLAAASFSSFIANALIGGGMMADGLGLDARLDGRPVRMLTACVMLAGCLVALLVIFLQQGGATSILIAQGATLVAAPLCAVILYVLSSNRKLMGPLRNGYAAMAIGAGGLAVVFYLMWGLLTGLAQRLLGG